MVCQASAQVSDGDCLQGTLRLVDGVTVATSAGRVEVCVNNIWGTITFSNDFQEEARVICQQLGYVVPEGMHVCMCTYF